MAEFIKKIFRNELFRGSLTLFMLINIGNVLSYLFHFVMARMLGPADYGILAALTSLTYIFNMPTFSIQTIISKETTKMKIKGEFGRIKGMLYHSIKKFILISLALLFVFAVISAAFLSGYLNISLWLLILTGVSLVGAFLYSIGIGILQGLKKFRTWGWNFIIDCGIRLISSIALVLIGFRVYGAIIGTLLGIFIAFIFIFPFIKKVTGAKLIKKDVKVFSGESLATFLAMLFIVFMYSLDVILAKGFFSGELAGQYAIASLVGKIIFFSMLAIANAMFPISSEKFIDGGKKKSREIAKKVGFIAFLLCFIAVAFLALIPKFIISLLFGAEYLGIAEILVYTGAAFSFISFLMIFLLYRISTDEFRLYHVLFLAVFLINHLLFLFLFHETVKQFSIIFMISAITSFLGSLILIRKWSK